MSGLPRFVQRAPSFFYGAAILYFVVKVALDYLQLANTYQGVEDSPAFSQMDSIYRLGLFSAVLQAAEGALYLFANGVMAHILLAIWQRSSADPSQNAEAAE